MVGTTTSLRLVRVIPTHAIGQHLLGYATVISALPPKADMCGATRDVRYVPIADIDDSSLAMLGCCAPAI